MLEKKYFPGFILLFLLIFCIHPAQAIILKVHNSLAYQVDIEGSFLHLERETGYSNVEYLKNVEHISPNSSPITLVSMHYPENPLKYKDCLSGLINYKYIYNDEDLPEDCCQIYFKYRVVFDENHVLQVAEATINRLDISGKVLEKAYKTYRSEGESLIFTISDIR